jgi:7,8-dihydropterin-6-yl-methyl-4-(beta-D-ribofuranosyl)aminobenzene 5'-phosphate synthase
VLHARVTIADAIESGFSSIGGIAKPLSQKSILTVMSKLKKRRLVLLFICILILTQYIFPKTLKAQEGNIMNQYSGDMTTVPLANISLTIVYDNNSYKEGLSAAWGFSCLIKGTEKTILFDTGGKRTILLSNMDKLGINPEDIDLVVLSHFHYDHVGGLEGLLQSNKARTVFFPASFQARFEEDLINFGVQTVMIQDPALICKGVYSTGELGMGIREQSLIIHTDKGILIITGCAHPGIVKIIRTAKKLLGADVMLITGGFHLAGASKSVIDEIISEIKELGVRRVGPCHCSGDLARQLFKIEYGDNYIDAGVGRMISFK